MNEPSLTHKFGEWSVESLRLTTFHGVKSPPQGLWSELMGINPESQDSRPREQFTREQGPLGENRLLLETQRQRLDWKVFPSPPPAASNGGSDVPNLLAVEQGVELLQNALTVTLKHISLVNRLALGVVLLKSAMDSSEGIATIVKYVPHLASALDGTSDLIYQINRKRHSRVAPHVEINRLCKWTLEQYQGGALLISPSQNPVFQPDKTRFLAKASLDINTVPSDTAISTKRMPALLGEFIELAREVAIKGDIS